MDMSMIGGIFSSLNAATNITKAMIGLRDTALIQEKVIELQGAILQAQQAAFGANEERTSLVDRVRELEETMRSLEAWETEKQRYKLQSVPNGGAFVYALAPETQGTEPSHWICAACYTNGKKSILQRGEDTRNGLWPWHCSSCKAVILADWQGPLVF